MILFSEEIQDRLSSHVYKNENRGRVGILSQVEERKTETCPVPIHKGLQLFELKLLTARSCCRVYFSTNLQVFPKPGRPDCSGWRLQGTAVALATEFLLNELDAFPTAGKDITYKQEPE